MVYIHNKNQNQNENISDLLIALLFILPLAVIYYGFNVIFRCGFAVLLCCFFDFYGQKLFFGEIRDKNISPIATGLIIAFLLPSGAGFCFYVLACFIAIFVAKLPFGGYGNNIFNPAAVGLSFVAISFKASFFNYALPLKNEASAVGTILSSLKDGAEPVIEKFHAFIGNQPGAIGCTQILMICVCLSFLIYKKAIVPKITFSFLGTCALISFLVPRIPEQRLNSVFYELCSGMLFFAAVFMLTDPVTAPKFTQSQIIYGIFAGMLTMVFRYKGELEEGVLFAILLSNAVVNILDGFFKRYLKIKKRTAEN